jgi:E3 ubiquitin-protein ligase RFWD2
MLVSGSDDGKAKVWSTRDRNSVLDVDIRANVCCVKARALYTLRVAGAA